MRALVFDGKQLVLDPNQPEPKQDEQHAIVTPICMGVCDTDLQIIQGYSGFLGILGHEFVGRVESGPKAWVGKRIVADINFACEKCDWCAAGNQHHCPNRTVMGIVGAAGAFAERMAIPVANLLEVPDGVPNEAAVFTEPLAAAFQILEQVHITETSQVLVLGDGKLGLLCAQVLATTGAKVTVSGRHASKLARISGRGIHAVLAPDWQGRPFDLVVEATGTRNGLQQAIAAVRPQGTVVLKSTVAQEHSLSLASIVVDEIRLLGSRCGPFPKALAALAADQVDVRPLIDASYPLEQAVEAVAHAGRKGTMKVLITADPTD